MGTMTETERLEQVLRGQYRLMDQVHAWLEEEDKHDHILRAVVRSSRDERPVHIPGQEGSRVFHLDSIRRLCIRYRLRFLDAGLYKGEIPSQAVHAIRMLEQRVGGPVNSFKMMAPAGRFRLCDSEADPLLFVPVGNDRYYLVCKWGTDLRRWRMLPGWPFRSPVHLAFTVFLAALAITAITPTHLITTDPSASAWGVHRILFLAWVSVVCTSFTVFGWFAFFGQFSSPNWNSRYFN